MAIAKTKNNNTAANLGFEAIRFIEADFGPEHADTFRRDLHKDLKAQFVIANPPFNDSDWHRADDDVRWQYGTPPKGNANFAWVQHFYSTQTHVCLWFLAKNKNSDATRVHSGLARNPDGQLRRSRLQRVNPLVFITETHSRRACVPID